MKNKQGIIIRFVNKLSIISTLLRKVKFYKKVTLPVCFILTITHSSAQNTFQKTYGLINNTVQNPDFGYSVQQTKDSGFIIAGSRWVSIAVDNASQSIPSALLLKTDETGALVWSRSYGIHGSIGDVYGSIDCRSGMQTNDGGYILAGNADAGYGAWIFLLKTNENGDIAWSKIIKAELDSFFHAPLYCYAIEQTNDNGYIITGETENANNNVYLLKADSIGNVQWIKSYTSPVRLEIGNAVRQTSDSGYVIAGYGGGEAALLMKTNKNGDLVWSKLYGDDAGYFTNAKSVIQTADGGYAVTGGYLALLKTDANGNVVWVKKYGGEVPLVIGNSIKQTTDGGYVIAGSNLSSGNGVYVVKTDANGDSLWTRVYGDFNYGYSDNGRSIYQLYNKGYIIVGRWQSGIYLIKTDGSGNSGCNEFSVNAEIVTTALNISQQDFLITNLQSGIVDSPFIVNSASTQVTALCYVLPVTWLHFTAEKKGASVLLKWTTAQEQNVDKYNIERSTDGIHFKLIGSITASHNNSTVRNYQFTDEIPLQGENFYRIKQMNYDENFIYSAVTQINYENNDAGQITIAPNPFSNSTTISFILPQSQKVTISIFDMNGRLIKTLVDAQMQPGIHQVTWNTRDDKGNAVSTGIYLLKLRAGNYVETKKISVIK